MRNATPYNLAEKVQADPLISRKGRLAYADAAFEEVARSRGTEATLPPNGPPAHYTAPNLRCYRITGGGGVHINSNWCVYGLLSGTGEEKGGGRREEAPQ